MSATYSLHWADAGDAPSTGPASLTIPLNQSLSYHWCGKFQAPSPDWLHLTRELTDYELFLVTEGTLYIASQQGEFQVSKGQYLLMPPSPRQYGYRSSSCSFYWMHFELDQPAGADIQWGPGIHLPMQERLESPERIIILINQLQDTSRRYGHKATSDLACTGVLLEISNQLALQYPDRTEDSSLAKKRLYTSILDYISWNRISNIRVSELSHYFGYHEKYLSAFFKEMAGIPLKQYLLREKMEYAKAQLMDTTLTIAQIGSTVGFVDSHNFSNAFKKVTGLTPSEYRSNCLKVPRNP